MSILDLNSLILAGVYPISSSNTILNAPTFTGDAQLIISLPTVSSNSSIIQTIITLDQQVLTRENSQDDWSEWLPNSGDAVQTYPTVGDFPIVGSISKIYIAQDTSIIYIWNGTEYISQSPSATTNVLSLSGNILESIVNGIASNPVSVQPLISSPTLGDFVTVASNGAIQDSGISFTQSGSSNSSVEIASTAGVQAAIAASIINNTSPRGGYDASTNVFPSMGGSGISGSIRANDFWYANQSGTLGGTLVSVGTLITALIAIPGQDPANWVINNNGVVSFNARSGLVMPILGDYSFSLISGISGISQGGTGQITPNAAFNALNPMTTIGDIIYASSTNVASRLGIGSSGQFLSVSSGTPSWTSLPSNVISFSAGTTGLSPNTPTSGVVTLSGILNIANGGTGSATQQNAINALTGTQSSGKYLRSDGTNSSLDTIHASDVPPLNQNTTGNAANITGGLAGAILYQNALNITGFSTIGTSGQIFTSGGSGPPTWSTSTITPTANAIPMWDTNKNIAANSLLSGNSSTATAAGTTTLTASSPQEQVFTGNSNQTVVLPVVSTLSVGQSFTVNNQSSGSPLIINSSGGNQIDIVKSNSICTFIVASTSGTTAASWYSTGKLATQAQNVITNYATTATSVTTVSLLANSAYVQIFTGSVAQILKLPNATTLFAPTGFKIINNSTATMTIQDNSGTVLFSLVPKLVANLLVTNTGTTSGVWYYGIETTQGGFNEVIANQPSGTTQSILSATETTVTIWTNIQNDVLNQWNGATGIFTANSAGLYFIRAGLGFVTNGVGLRYAEVYRNAGNVFTLTSMSNPSAMYVTELSGSGLVRCSAGDTLQIKASQTSGTSLLTTDNVFVNQIHITKVSE